MAMSDGTLPTPGYFCLIVPCVNPDRKMVFDMKFGTDIFCNVTKKKKNDRKRFSKLQL